MPVLPPRVCCFGAFGVREEEHECEQEHGRFFTRHRVVLDG